MPLLIIGDMNVPYHQAVEIYQQEPIIRVTYGLTPVLPDMPFTHISKSRGTRRLIDYAWQNHLPGISARPPNPDYEEWDCIDHASITYHLPTVIEGRQ